MKATKINENDAFVCDDCDIVIKNGVTLEFGCTGTTSLCQKHAKELLTKLQKALKE